MNNNSSNIFLLNKDGIWYCFTDLERKIIIDNDSTIKNDDFKLINSYEDIQKCLKSRNEDTRNILFKREQNPNYIHPKYICLNIIPIKKYIKNLINDKNKNINHKYIISEINKDLIFKLDIKLQIDGDITYDTTNFNDIKQQMFNVSKDISINTIDIVIHVMEYYYKNNKKIAHNFVIFIHATRIQHFFYNWNVDKIDLVDTGPTRNTKQSIFNVLREISEKISLYINPENDSIITEYSTKYDIFLQKYEKELKLHGFCNAWSLFFIYQIFINNETLDSLYSNFKTKNKSYILSTIVTWWDKIILDSGITI